jgi:hypothetical protein
VRRTVFTLVAVTSALTSAVVLAGCSSSSGGSTASADRSVTTAPASSTTSTTSTPTASSTTASDNAVATSLDPCQLVTSSEASSLAGVSYGKGEEKTSDHGKGKQCVYGSQTRNVFTVEVGQASSAAEAEAEWATAQAQAKALVASKLPPGIHVTLATDSVSGVGDRASTVHGDATIGGQAVGFSGIYALKGPTFFAFQDLAVGTSAPSVSDLTSQAQTTAGRVS